jgi:hypothetical protein
MKDIFLCISSKSHHEEKILGKYLIAVPEYRENPVGTSHFVRRYTFAGFNFRGK